MSLDRGAASLSTLLAMECFLQVAALFHRPSRIPVAKL